MSIKEYMAQFHLLASHVSLVENKQSRLGRYMNGHDGNQ